ncbi:hypothetical protein HOP50_03g21950 [Chloropicon primus]|uniref:Cathepsin propeptide inhibitor domain-containing protein n=1 Tax=Chloropicon primus TaxID=1764295 RepID=A0A5B8MGZ4_9CHLO|nr:hypothetical protein A3770_03p21950 [Chloropicon primus]UPQ98889.1 hypothetical protein HOP50_03g21950 [Chloropicon primus]|eukprot:QDZ19677.1 hypothetical protein A3770_03p21950 [Chloropicon primus]
MGVRNTMARSLCLVFMAVMVFVAGLCEAAPMSPEEIIRTNEDFARNMIPKFFKRGNPRSKHWREVFNYFEGNLGKKFQSKFQLCECGMKKLEDKTAYWLNIGQKKKCRTDVFRLQKIFYQSIDGEWSTGSINDFEASSVDMDFSGKGGEL